MTSCQQLLTSRSDEEHDVLTCHRDTVDPALIICLAIASCDLYFMEAQSVTFTSVFSFVFLFELWGFAITISNMGSHLGITLPVTSTLVLTDMLIMVTSHTSCVIGIYFIVIFALLRSFWYHNCQKVEMEPSMAFQISYYGRLRRLRPYPDSARAFVSDSLTQSREKRLKLRYSEPNFHKLQSLPDFGASERL